MMRLQRGFAAAGLQQQVCSGRFAAAGLQRQVCSGRFAAAGLQRQVCSSRFAAAGLQQQVCSSRFAARVCSGRFAARVCSGVSVPLPPRAICSAFKNIRKIGLGLERNNAGRTEIRKTLKNDWIFFKNGGILTFQNIPKIS